MTVNLYAPFERTINKTEKAMLRQQVCYTCTNEASIFLSWRSDRGRINVTELRNDRACLISTSLPNSNSPPLLARRQMRLNHLTVKLNTKPRLIGQREITIFKQRPVAQHDLIHPIAFAQHRLRRRKIPHHRRPLSGRHYARSEE